MGLTSSLSTGLSGLAANQAQLDVLGNNIANTNTTGFKSSDLDFKTQFLQTFSYGTAPDSALGGTNPLQVGMGTTQAAITTNFSNGSLNTTGVNTDLALQGNGFFVLQGTSQSFTRDGSFQLNSNKILVNGDGQRVQGFGIDANFNVVPGVLKDVSIPLGSLTIAKATTNVPMIGQLNTSGTIATTVSDITMGPPMYLAGPGAVDPTNPPTSATLLTNVTDSTNVPLFQTGDVLTATGTKNGRIMAAQTLTVTSTTTLGDLQSFFQGTLGINTTAGINGSAAAPGVSLTAASNTATLQVDGNLGLNNDLVLTPSSLSIVRAGNTITPFNALTQNAHANGQSIYTTLTAFDSLGNKIVTGVTATLTGADASGTQWTYTAESAAGTATGVNVNECVGQGTINFNTLGQFVSATTPTVTVDRTGTGANPILSFSLDFSALSATAAGALNPSSLSSNANDGYASGTLDNFSIDQNGVITGTFGSNGQSRVLGQVAVATFANNEGLVSTGNNQFVSGPNSGTAVISTANQFSAGSITSGALELSNVDLSSEFVKLISASTGFSAASKIITTTNQLMQQLLQSVQ